MADLTPNINVGSVEAGAFSIGDMVYASILRNLLIEKIDDPNHMYDDRVLAMADGAFAYKEWKE